MQHFKSAAKAAGPRESTKFLAAAEAIASLLEEGGAAAISNALDILKEFNVEARDGHDLLTR